MLKALLRKQFLELTTWFYQDKKTGKKRSKAAMAGFIILYAVICACCCMIFFVVGGSLCGPLLAVDMGWLYMAIMGLIAMALGVFGSVFNTYAGLYRSKDNELLLSLPVPSSAILAVRLFGVWFWGLVYEALVFLPAMILFWINGRGTVQNVILDLILMLVISIFVLALSCILGWLIAKITARMKSKSFFTVVLSLLFMGGYYYFYFQAYSILQQLLANAEAVGAKVKGAAYPLYLLGKGADGGILEAVSFTALVLILFGLVWLILSKSFLRIATTREAVKTRYKEEKAKRRSMGSALLQKERRRFLSSSTYMLNCGLGTLFLVAAAVFLIVKEKMVSELIGGLTGDFAGLKLAIPVFAVGAVCGMISMNDMTAPSISLEGKTIWLLQSLPIEPWQVLKAKLKLQLLLTGIPTLLCQAALLYVLKPDGQTALLILLLPQLFALLTAVFGLVVNLKAPNLNWMSETAAVKQSVGVAIVLFGSLLLVMALIIVYLALEETLAVGNYLLICTLLVAALDGIMLLWLKKRGTAILKTL